MTGRARAREGKARARTKGRGGKLGGPYSSWHPTIGPQFYKRGP